MFPNLKEMCLQHKPRTATGACKDKKFQPLDASPKAKVSSLYKMVLHPLSWSAWLQKHC